MPETFGGRKVDKVLKSCLGIGVWSGVRSSGSSGCQEEAKNSKSHDIVRDLWELFLKIFNGGSMTVV